MSTKRDNLKCKLDEFLTSKEIKWNFHVDETEMSKDSLGYDMIIGLDIVSPTSWITGTGAISIKRICNLKFKLDEFSTSKEIKWKFHVDETEMSKDSLGYDMSICLDLLFELGLNTNCEEKVVE